MRALRLRHSHVLPLSVNADGFDVVPNFTFTFSPLRDDQGRLYKLTQEERYEIAAEMIYRWMRWADA